MDRSVQVKFATHYIFLFLLNKRMVSAESDPQSARNTN